MNEEEDWFDLDEERHLQTGIALGYLSLLPLIFCYELAVASGRAGARNLSELLLFGVLSPLGGYAVLARWGILAGLGLWAAVYCARRSEQLALFPRLLRLVGEAALYALLFGPLLAGAFHLVGGELPAQVTRVGEVLRDPADLPLAGVIVGGAAYEELVFRVGIFCLLFLIVRSLVSFLGAPKAGARWLAEVLALVGSAVLFAAFHVSEFSGWLGRGLEPFHMGIFMWRTLAGLSLAVLFRLRGPGVAAWTHALFNLALFLGAGPEVFL